MSVMKPTKNDHQKLIVINPTRLSKPLLDSYFNKCRRPPKLDNIISKYTISYDDNKSVYFLHLVITKKLIRMNPIGLSVPWNYSYLNNYILPKNLEHQNLIYFYFKNCMRRPKLDINIPK